MFQVVRAKAREKLKRGGDFEIKAYIFRTTSKGIALKRGGGPPPLTLWLDPGCYVRIYNVCVCVCVCVAKNIVI